MIVVLVMGIVAAVAVPKYAESMARYRAEVTALRIAADLKRARQDAITSSAGRTVNIDVASNNYTIPDLPSLDHPDQDHAVNLGAAPYHAKLLSADFGGSPDLTFDLYGVPASGGEIHIGSGAYTRIIKVDAETGKVSVP